ncbi:MAG: hypothetical protein KGM24_04720 [Elusimicrobia bacterium]|nr:hypothetical protein [Elusimicrobiota bacterium]
MRRLLAALLLPLLAAPAFAIRPSASASANAKRFGLDRFSAPVFKAPSAAALRAFTSFNAAAGGRWRLRVNSRTGYPSSIAGGSDVPRPGRPEDAGREFLAAHQDMLGVDPAALTVRRVNQGRGLRHVLYRQTYRGLPVEFASVKVHMDDQGAVVGVDSTFEPSLNVPTTPSVSASAAAADAEADAGAGAVLQGAPTLVILPVRETGQDRLAWKMRIDGAPGGSWRYYVDAQNGQILFRYGIEEFALCVTSGVVSGQVYDVDPSSTPGPVVRPFNDEYVYIGDGSTRVETAHDATYGDGFFCAGLQGKVEMSLQGPWVNVAEFRGPSAHYDNGAGVWTTVATPVSSPHPYPNSSVLVSTIDLTAAAPNAVEFLPVFTSFSVGGFTGGSGEGGSITDDDQLFVYNSYGEPVASYIGARGAFNAAAVHGQRMNLELRSNASGQHTGYDIAVSSYLSVTSPFTWGAAGSSHTWTTADTSLKLHGEMDLFYHLNEMHDYFMSDVDKSSAAPIVSPVVAMAHVGPDLLNAFYDPDEDDLYFGDESNSAPSDLFMEDATVPHHEYVHYVVEKIWSIQNFGQAGAISEANADYFAASSLDDPAIGQYVNVSLGNSGPLRQLDCQSATSSCNCPSVGPHPCYYKLGTTATPWTGEIHSDSPFVSQTLWDIRRYAIANSDYSIGRSCADGLEFQSLLFFPESFGELYDAMLKVAQNGSVAACGSVPGIAAEVTTAFGDRGLIASAGTGDAYEPNGGFETAVDISTLGPVSATIYPAADQDFWSFGAGPGLVQVAMQLPSIGGGLYKAYQLQLFDSSRHEVASAEPPYDGYGTLDGYCDMTSASNPNGCTTTASKVTLSYNNPSGGLLYVEVAGGTYGYGGSNSDVNSTIPYVLSVSYPAASALSGQIVSAGLDKDVIGFTVNVSSFVSNQDWRFDHAQLRDESQTPMPGTDTRSSGYLLFLSSANAGGKITGQVQLAPGFSSRYPGAGTVYLEVFGYDVLGSTVSLGLSNAINLTAASPELTAYNNLFDPIKGQHAIVKYATDAPGHLTMTLYTVTGRRVKTLYDGEVPAGKGSVDWDGKNLSGTVVASGVYVVRADGPGLKTTTKIVVVK